MYTAYVHVVDVHTNIISYGTYVHDTYENSLMGIQCAHRVTVTRVSRVATEKHVSGGNFIYCI